jgi:hypothetical protein
MSKLHVPAPGERSGDPYGVDDILFYAFAICLAFVALGYFFWIDRDPGPEHVAHALIRAASVEESAEVDPSSQVHFFLALTGEELDTYVWDDATLMRVFAFGPRSASEAACAYLGPKLSGGEVEGGIIEAMVQGVEAHNPQGPWSCLSRLFLDDELSNVGVLEEGLEVFWREVETFESHQEIVESVVVDFRTKRSRPGSERFYRWLRLCGIQPAYSPSGECLRLLRQISPAQGEDVLTMIDKHLEGGELSTDELLRIIDGVGYVAIHGQPSRWRIAETRALPAYDIDLRIGAVMMLCRLVNAPDDNLSRAAARRLSQAAAVVARTADPHLIFRWRAGCRVGFGREGADSYTPVPLLAVWTGNSDEAPAYSLRDAIERGDCEVREGLPIWACGVRRWTGEGRTVPQYLNEVWTHSRYIEWADR